MGYGEHPPHPEWPGGAAIAVNFNLNVEGGGEASLENGDFLSEGMLNAALRSLSLKGLGRWVAAPASHAVPLPAVPVIKIIGIFPITLSCLISPRNSWVHFQSESTSSYFLWRSRSSAE